MLNKFSSCITQNIKHAPAQAMLFSLGLTKQDLNKPQIGIASMGYAGNPCNSKLNQYASAINSSILKQNAIPMLFNTIGISDGISMGTEGMRYSLPSRELISDSIESVVRAHHYDGIICIPGCDKNLPASLLALIQLNRPGLIVYGGSMKSSPYKQKPLDIISAFESYGQFTSGKITNKERSLIVENACNKQGGSCAGLYTANTMALCLETMGLIIPNGSSTLSTTTAKFDECKKIGSIMYNLIERDIKPLDILTKDSFLNAITITYAFGGSTNAIIHLLACAKSANISLNVDDFNSLSFVPVIANMKPHGKYLMEDLSNIGGTSRVIKYLIEENLINGNCLTITGKSLWENVKNVKRLNFNNQKIIRSLSDPFKEDSHIKILKGNIAPHGCLSKIYKSIKVIGGKALVFDNEYDMINALNKGKISRNNIIVIRYQGESIGCPEMLLPTSAVMGYFDNDPPPIITDGRFSGGSNGVLVAHLPDSL